MNDPRYQVLWGIGTPEEINLQPTRSCCGGEKKFEPLPEARGHEAS